jgi:BirA family biotin operon repressor/biotin-[acetyl-CoA-carboxylase] ligase
MIIGSKIIYLENLPSTNTYLAAILKKDNLSEGTIVYTNFQLSGRGYSGNTWESESDKNLLFSILLFPSFIDPSEEFFLSMTISLGIRDFLLRYIPSCSIKWPNDIYVKNDKIAGILIDGTLSGDMIENVIAGIGLNINQEKFSMAVPNPVSLKQLTGNTYDIQECLNELAGDLDRRYKQLIGGDASQIREDYLRNLYRFRQWAEFSDSTGTFTGRISEIRNDGQIIIEKEGGMQAEYYYKEVEFIL